MEIKVSLDEKKIMKMALEGMTEKEVASDIVNSLKSMVRSKLYGVLEEKVSLYFKNKDSHINKCISEIIKKDLKKNVIKTLKKDLENIDFEDIICNVISDNLNVKASIDLKDSK